MVSRRKRELPQRGGSIEQVIVNYDLAEQFRREELDRVLAALDARREARDRADNLDSEG